MYREYGQWHSPSLGRTMQFLWFGQFGRPVMLFPTSGGGFNENEDFHLTSALSDKVDRGEIQLVCVDSVDQESWYNRSVHPAVRAARMPSDVAERGNSSTSSSCPTTKAAIPQPPSERRRPSRSGSRSDT